MFNVATSANISYVNSLQLSANSTAMANTVWILVNKPIHVININSKKSEFVLANNFGLHILQFGSLPNNNTFNSKPADVVNNNNNNKGMSKRAVN